MSWKGRQKQTAPAALGKVLSAALDAGARAVDPPMPTASDLGAQVFPPLFASAGIDPVRREALKRAVIARQGAVAAEIVKTAQTFEAYLAGTDPVAAAGKDEDPKAGEPRGA